MKHKLLIIGSVWPEPKSSAAGSRMMQLIDVFHSAGYKTTFVSAAAKTERSVDLESLGVSENTIELNSSSFDNYIKKLRPDIVVFDRFMTEEQFGWRVTEHCPDAIRILDTEDLHGLRKGRQKAFETEATFDRSFLFNDSAKREIASIYRCDLSLIISEAEMDILAQVFRVPRSLLYYLPFLLEPLSVNERENLPDYGTRSDFVTIGNFIHPPNFQSVKYLKQQIWPLIRKQLPEAELHIYGAYCSEKVERLHEPKQGFYIKGFAEDVDTIMQNARVCLAPIQFGAGLKGKLIDAMKNGTPCIMSSVAAEGLFGELPANGFIADAVADFVNSAVALHNNEAIWNDTSRNGFQVINTRFQKSDFKSDFLQLIKDLRSILKEHREENFIGQLLQHHSLQSTKYLSKWIEAKNNPN